MDSTREGSSTFGLVPGPHVCFAIYKHKDSKVRDTFKDSERLFGVLTGRPVMQEMDHFFLFSSQASSRGYGAHLTFKPRLLTTPTTNYL